MKSNGKSIGTSFRCTVQERITNFRDATGELINPDTDWIPDPNKPGTTDDEGGNSSFTFGVPYTQQYGPPYSNGFDLSIRDFKCATTQAGNPTGVVGSYTQYNRIFWYDSQGKMVVVDLGSQDWTITGTTSQTSIDYK